jgi:hypothetical protein
LPALTLPSPSAESVPKLDCLIFPPQASSLSPK